MIKCAHTGGTEKMCLFLLARSLSALYVYAIHSSAETGVLFLKSIFMQILYMMYHVDSVYCYNIYSRLFFLTYTVIALKCIWLS